MNTKYKVLLVESKKLNGAGLLQKASANNITADKILYEYAIQMVKNNKKKKKNKFIGTLLDSNKIYFFIIIFSVNQLL